MKDKPQVGDHSKWNFPDEVWDWMRRQSQVLDPEDERRILEEMEKDGFDWEAWGDSACADEMVSEMSEEEKRLCREDPLKYFGID